MIDVVRVLKAECLGSGRPVAKEILKKIDEGDWLGLVRMRTEPGDYENPLEFFQDATLTSLLRKCEGLPTQVDTASAAMQNFWKSEKQCYRTNERLNPYLMDADDASLHGPGLIIRDPHVEELITAWRSEIRQVLGAPPKRLRGRFGPGSTFHQKSNAITIPQKISENATRTTEIAPLLHVWQETAAYRYGQQHIVPPGLWDGSSESDHRRKQPDFLWVAGALLPPNRDTDFMRREACVVHGSRFTTVPKDALKARGIAVEPSINVFIQLALGSAIEERLKKAYGWSKNRVQDAHRLLAKIASRTGACATIDLSSASDTIARNLVRLLLPRGWLELLEQSRTRRTQVGGRWVFLEKFSSMGNGFTFELETLLFYTLSRCVVRAVCEDLLDVENCDRRSPNYGVKTSVFGDDIIVPTKAAKPLIAALRFFGFEVNVEKTFIEGPFRESCGGDFFNGQAVRPYFLKELPKEPHQWISILNGLHRNYEQLRALGHEPPLKGWRVALGALPSNLRQLRGPKELGDLVITDRRWESYNPRVERSGISYIRVWRPVPNRLMPWGQFRPGVVVAAALYGVPSGVPTAGPSSRPYAERCKVSGIVPRINGSYVSGYRTGRVPYS